MEDAVKPADGRPGVAAFHPHKARTALPHILVISACVGTILLMIAGLVVAKLPARAPDASSDMTAMIAHFSRPMPDGVNCRKIIYDNTLARTIEEKIEPCHAPRDPPKARARSMLNWYGK
jgi:hypothetical protein